MWGGLPNQKPSLTSRYSGMSPWGCCLGLFACILPTHGCQSLLAPDCTHPTSAIPPCLCLSTSLSACWQCLHTQPAVLTWCCTLSDCPMHGVFLLTPVHLPFGTCACECVHTSACGASPLYSSVSVHLCFSVRLSLPLRVLWSLKKKKKIGNKKGEDSQYTNTGVWCPRPPMGIIFSFSAKL